MTLQEQEQIDFFFAPPLPEQTGDQRSVLHLARRETQDCLIGDWMPEDQVIAAPPRPLHRVFATAMMIMAGIDLLAKFYAGSDKQGQLRDRIEDFAKEFIFKGDPAADKFAKVLYYGCRNPLVHSFTLYPGTSPKVNYKVQLTYGLPRRDVVVWQLPETPDTFMIDIEDLYAAFVKAVNAYETRLRAEADLQAKFTAMFPLYGSIEMHTIGGV